MGRTSENAEQRHAIREISSEKKMLPVLSVIAADFDLGTVARTLLRANQHGFFAFVIVPKSDDSRIGPLAEKLDAIVLEFDFSDGEPPLGTVERVARAMGFPAILYFDDADAYVDFSRCRDIVETVDSYSVEAPVVDDGSEPGEVVAAIPTYNEQGTIESVVSDVQRHVDEVIVVDDGSGDDTVAIAERAGATVIEHETNRGYGAALQTAFSAGDDRNAESLVVLDGDGQHDPEDIPKLLEVQNESGVSVVVGSRFHGEGVNVPYYRRVGLFVINVLTNLSLGASPTRSWVTDTQSGFRVYDARAVGSLANDDTLSDDMSASTDILYHARRMDYDVEEVGTTICYQGGETSTQNPFFHGLTVVSNILRTIERERPLTYLGVPGLTAILLGIGLGYWTIVNYLQSGTFPTGIMLFCIFSTVLGSLLSFTSIILHSVKTQVETIADRPMEG